MLCVDFECEAHTEAIRTSTLKVAKYKTKINRAVAFDACERFLKIDIRNGAGWFVNITLAIIIII